MVTEDDAAHRVVGVDDVPVYRGLLVLVRDRGFLNGKWVGICELTRSDLGRHLDREVSC
jgi:hypothetical protein